MKKGPKAVNFPDKAEKAGIARRQGVRACAVGGAVLLLQIPVICNEQAWECVLIERRR